MIIEKPRVLPRVAIATLALGGPSVLAGCGGGANSSANAVQAFCNQQVSCGSSGTVAACESYYNNQLSYYDTACQGAIRNALACIANASCNDVTGCKSAIQVTISTCFSVSSAVADYCGRQNVCIYGGLANGGLAYAKSCRNYDTGKENALYNYYGSNCLQAYDALLECMSQLSCSETAIPSCSAQLYNYHHYCS